MARDYFNMYSMSGRQYLRRKHLGLLPLNPLWVRAGMFGCDSDHARKSNDGCLMTRMASPILTQLIYKPAAQLPLPSLPQTLSARHNSDTFFSFFLWGTVLRMRPDYSHCSLANGPVLRDWYSQSKVLIAFIFRQHAVKWSEALLCLTLNVFPSLIGSRVGSSANRRVGVWSPSAGRLSNCPQIASNGGFKGAKKNKKK